MPWKKNIFLRPPEGYIRNLDILTEAIETSATYLSIETGKPIEECRNFINKEIQPDGKFPLKEIEFRGLKRNNVGDREKASINVNKFLSKIYETEAILTPNMVAYDNPNKNESCTGKSLVNKMAKRNIIKKKGLEAWQYKDLDTFALCNNEEYNIKLLSNSVSGAHANQHNPLFNKTAHSSLTSNSRVIVSYSNASTEKFISGNRHYHSYQVVLENIITIIRNTNYDILISVLEKYDMYLPTTQDIMAMINNSTFFYWRNIHYTSEIFSLIEKLTPYQKAAFYYIGDLFHIAKHNDQLVRNFITEIITRPNIQELENPDDVIKNIDEGIITLAGILCADILAGLTPKQIKEESPYNYNIYANTIKYVNEVIIKYSDFLIAFFVTDNVPSSIYYFPSSIRRSVVGSDTDSTMFTVQDWVIWYYSKLIFGFEPDKVSNVLCYLNAQIIAHMLAITSKQMGVVEKNLYNLKMKNEYGFPVYLRSNRAKHYATLLASREGNVYKDPKLDIKGVGLKDSKIPKLIMKALEKEINHTMLTILEGNGVNIEPLMQKIANLEHTIYNDIEKGDIKYLSTVNIQTVDTYKKPMSSKYMHYDLWVNVFECKFGAIETPPYRAVKVNVDLDSPTKLKQWIDSLDPVLANAFRDWLLVNKKKELAVLYLPYGLFESGIPNDIMRIIDKRKTTSELVNGFYILMEMLGFYIKNSKATYMLFDDISFRPEFGLPGEFK